MARKDEISLHPKYGLNPSVGICFWCGQETGEILLFGYAIKEEAPRRVTASYAPCDECSRKWEQGFVFLEAALEPLAEGQPEISPGAYPTGNYAVINPEAATKIMGDERARKGVALMSIEQFKQLTEKVAEELPNDHS